MSRILAAAKPISVYARAQPCAMLRAARVAPVAAPLSTLRALPRFTQARPSSLGVAAAAVAVATLATLAVTKADADAAPAGAAALSPAEFRPFRLAKITKINHNTSSFEFELPASATELGLPVCSCVMVRATLPNGETVMRPYTPVERAGATTFELVVKQYAGGPMSTHIHGLKVGDSLELKGPFPKFAYQPNTHRELGMIAGGTGITPMLQLLRAIAADKADKTRATLLFANVSRCDILLRCELRRLEKCSGGRIRVVHTLEKPGWFWCGETGRVSSAMVQKYLPPASDAGSRILICGPSPMLQALSGDKLPDRSQGPIGGVLKELGYSSAQVYKF